MRGSVDLGFDVVINKKNVSFIHFFKIVEGFAFFRLKNFYLSSMEN